MACPYDGASPAVQDMLRAEGAFECVKLIENEYARVPRWRWALRVFLSGCVETLTNEVFRLAASSARHDQEDC